MKTFDEIEALIASKEKEKDLKAQELAAIKEMAAEELETAREAKAAADEAIDRKAYEKAAGAEWVAERKVIKATKDFETFSESSTEELLDIEAELSNLSENISNDAADICARISEELSKSIEELKDKESKIIALYDRLGSLQGRNVSDYLRFELFALVKMNRAAQELATHSTSYYMARNYAESAPLSPGRLVIPGQKVD